MLAQRRFMKVYSFVRVLKIRPRLRGCSGDTLTRCKEIQCNMHFHLSHTEMQTDLVFLAGKAETYSICYELISLFYSSAFTSGLGHYKLDLSY